MFLTLETNKFPSRIAQVGPSEHLYNTSWTLEVNYPTNQFLKRPVSKKTFLCVVTCYETVRQAGWQAGFEPQGHVEER